MKLHILVFSICVLASGCSKDKKNEGGSGVMLDFAEILDCHHEAKWTEKDIEEALEGEWVWMRQYNPWNSEYDEQIHQGITLKFADGMAIGREDSTGTTWTNWEFFDRNWCDVALKGTVRMDEITGCLRVCDDHLMFDNTPLDGFANIYRKK